MSSKKSERAHQQSRLHFCFPDVAGPLNNKTYSQQVLCLNEDLNGTYAIISLHFIRPNETTGAWGPGGGGWGGGRVSGDAALRSIRHDYEKKEEKRKRKRNQKKNRESYMKE